MNRWLLALALLGVSLGLSAVLFLLGFPFFFVVFFLPLLPLLDRRGRRVSRPRKPTGPHPQGPDTGAERRGREESWRIEIGMGMPKR